MLEDKKQKNVFIVTHKRSDGTAQKQTQTGHSIGRTHGLANSSYVVTSQQQVYAKPNGISIGSAICQTHYSDRETDHATPFVTIYRPHLRT